MGHSIRSCKGKLPGYGNNISKLWMIQFFFFFSKKFQTLLLRSLDCPFWMTSTTKQRDFNNYTLKFFSSGLFTRTAFHLRDLSNKNAAQANMGRGLLIVNTWGEKQYISIWEHNGLEHLRIFDGLPCLLSVCILGPWHWLCLFFIQKL